MTPYPVISNIIHHDQAGDLADMQTAVDEIEAKEFTEEIQLKMQLDSGRYMMEEFQRELTLKTMITQQIAECQRKHEHNIAYHFQKHEQENKQVNM